jgi:selenium metabolism protein YedF
MIMKTEIDARGKACPQPVIMTKAAVEKGEKELSVLVDNDVAASNVQRFLTKEGFSVSPHREGDTIVIEALAGENTHARPQEKSAPSYPSKGNKEEVAIFITRNILGGHDKELGEVLIKGFLGTLAQMDCPPRFIAFMNEGVLLALKGTSTCDYLLEMTEKGTTILVCGTCTNHFGVTEQVGVGTISNMFEITDTLLKATKVISI